MENSKTLYHFIIDRSGSMASCMTSTLNAYEEQLTRLTSLQEELPNQEISHSLTIFNNFVDQVIDFSPLEPGELGTSIAPRIKAEGSTALLDAIGLSVQRINNRYGDKIERNEMSVVVTILTDGYENASETFTYAQIASMIAKFENSGKWTFTILGAETDSFSIATRLNIRKENAMAFDKSDINEVFRVYGDAMQAYTRHKERGVITPEILRDIGEKDWRNKHR